MTQPDHTFTFGRRTAPDRGGERQELLRTLADTRVLIHQAYSGFNQAMDSDLIESYVFEINALQSRYNYLLRRIKQLEAVP